MLSLRPAPSNNPYALVSENNGVGPSDSYEHERIRSSEIKKRSWDGLLKIKIMGLEPAPELFAIAIVYFVQGILGLSDLALEYFMKDSLQLQPAQASLVLGVAEIPWVIKPLYGFISDSIPLWGYHRRSYLLVAGVVGTCAWSALALWVSSTGGTLTAMLLTGMSTAFSDVVIDAIVVELSRGAPQATAGSLQSLCWASKSVGVISTAYLSGRLVDIAGTRAVFGITALFPLVVSGTSFLIQENKSGMLSHAHNTTIATGSQAYQAVGVSDPHHPSEMPHGEVQECHPSSSCSGQGITKYGLAMWRELTFGLWVMWSQVQRLWSVIKRKSILLPTLFIFFWMATPSASVALFYFETSKLEFTPEFLGWLKLAGAVATLIGIIIYNSCLKSTSIRSILFWSMLLYAALSSTTLMLVSGLNRAIGISDQAFALGNEIILTLIGEVSFMPILVLSAQICPAGVEATLFATLMSLINGAESLGDALGSALTAALGVTASNFNNLFLLCALCIASGLLPAPLLLLLPRQLDDDSESLKPAGQEEEVQLIAVHHSNSGGKEHPLHEEH
ncbi:hypothetical protein CEUSTIGMA_g10604.t1 [Chlamydomonas eustigma]|uniref:Uncharacterized protein n=1 Tax=Chlamydomonas eustigma TaxID=1157962 RepID=A0A250XJD1_9CHLO|nr:hypothetical protein CEUSTIGMA_g10604.t1 [Chlamydomonas eustigma]|eukprot:GAX83178.1 hypothetical protein CEUSTIGMA_g10604.t1 [Chlamydomonas eustigma]